MRRRTRRRCELAYRAAQPGSRPAAGLARQGRAGLVRSRRRTRRRSTSRRRSTPRSSSTICSARRRSARTSRRPTSPDLFADFNGLPTRRRDDRVLPHDQHWSNRMILGDSLQVMASASPSARACAARCSASTSTRPTASSSTRNFQWSTTSRDVKDGKATTSPASRSRCKAFRDTWRDGIHSYLDLSARPADGGARPAAPRAARSSCRSAMRTCIACGR